MPSTYQLFVKQKMLAMRANDMKATDKMKHIAKLWQQSKGEPSSDDEVEAPKPRKTASKPAKGKKDIDLSKLLQQHNTKGGAIKAIDWQHWQV